MIQSKEFRTKTLRLKRQNIKVEGFWPIGLDIGYSGVKMASTNSVCCFPSYAKKLERGMVNITSPKSSQILYEDCSKGQTWVVGEIAQEISKGSGEINEAELYGQEWYFSEMYLVIARVGIALGCTANEYGSPKGELMIQTGLPCNYLKSDTMLIKEALMGEHHFRVKFAEEEWQEYHFTIEEKTIRVMPQPMGTLFAVAMNSDGYMTKDAKDIMESGGVVIFDAGFNTLDVFHLIKQSITSYQTYTEFSMREVFDRTCKRIYDKYHIVVTVPELQKFLQNGQVQVLNRKERRVTSEPFSDLLELSCKEVCSEAMDTMFNIFNGFVGVEYFVYSGGTSSAWKPYILDYLSGIETMQKISGNRNEDLPNIFNNVLGYYRHLCGYLRTLNHTA